MENQIEIYKQNSMPPKWALKEIQAGRLKGKTDIKPQWRIQALTEMFGLCGIGWYPKIKRFWTEAGANSEVSAFVEIELFIKHDGIWSEPIPGIGGSSFVAQESKGLYVSDECYKMAYTDALSVCCKMIGIGSDIYNGLTHDSKYDKKEPEKKEPKLKVIPEINEKFDFSKWDGSISENKTIIYSGIEFSLSEKAFNQLNDFLDAQEHDIKMQQLLK